MCRVQWNTYTPEASFETVCNGEQYASMILQQGGPEALAQWKRLEDEMRPLQQGASTFPAAALRSDVGTHIPCGLACCCALLVGLRLQTGYQHTECADVAVLNLIFLRSNDGHSQIQQH